MRFHRSALLPALLLLFTAHVQPLQAEAGSDSLDYEDYLRQAWQASRRPAAARADWALAEAARGQARALRAPSLNLELSSSYVSRHQELAMPGGRVEFGDGSNVDAALLAGWTLYAGGALEAGEGRAVATALARHEELISDSLRLAGELRASFLNALAASAAAQAAQLGVERLERHHAELLTRQAAGTLGEEAVLLSQSRLTQTRQELALRDGDLSAARLDLGSWLGRPGEAVVPVGSLESPLPGLEENARRPAALAALDAHRQAALSVERQQTAWRRPKVDVAAGWHLGRPGVDPVTNEWMGYGAASLRLRWSVWDGRLGRLREAEAGHARHALELRLQEAERESRGLLARSREWVGAALGAWEESVTREELETRRLELVESRWRQGMATERDWLDAQDDLRQAQVERALGAVRLRLAESRLLLAMGR